MKMMTLKNKNGMMMKVCDVGGIVPVLTAPDVRGRYEDVVLGAPGVLPNANYFGCLVGRVGNRIDKGMFKLGGKTYRLTKNNKVNTLHGGTVGFDSRVWAMRKFEAPDGPAVELTYFSPNGEEGFPGNLFTRVVYTLTHDDVWRIEYLAVTDEATPVNLTQHVYFNLTGCKRDILEHELQLFCGSYTPSDRHLIPTGEVATVAGTPLDFRKPMAIGARIGEKFPALKNAGGGYDNNFVIDRKQPSSAGQKTCATLVRCARVREPESGRVMECWTSEPCVQLYTSNMMSPMTGKKGVRYGKHFGLCLETQQPPNAINCPILGNTVLRPGEVYRQVTEYRFSAE